MMGSEKIPFDISHRNYRQRRSEKRMDPEIIDAVFISGEIITYSS
jgi:hypothetical protein